MFGVLRFIREKDNSKENINHRSRAIAASNTSKKRVTVHSVGGSATT